MSDQNISYNFYKANVDAIIEQVGKDKALYALEEMLKIRHFEQRGEQAYQMGKVWGFYHSYTGQEAIQTAAVLALGREKNLWVTTYRCHALALLLGMSVEEGMCELYGKENGNAQGRGGSMHLYTQNMFGGFGIVGGQWPIGAGLAFSLQYKNIDNEIAICFGGDGSIVQGTMHESMNLAMLWKLPVLYVIENNQLGMGTQIERAIATLPIGESLAKGYNAPCYTVDGMNFCDLYQVFSEAKKRILEEKTPVIIEAVTQRFRGHSISDAATYRSKEALKEIQKMDPLISFSQLLIEKGFLSEQDYQNISDSCKQKVLDAMKLADSSPYPDTNTLEQGVIV